MFVVCWMKWWDWQTLSSITVCQEFVVIKQKVDRMFNDILVCNSYVFILVSSDALGIQTDICQGSEVWKSCAGEILCGWSKAGNNYHENN